MFTWEGICRSSILVMILSTMIAIPAISTCVAQPVTLCNVELPKAAAPYLEKVKEKYHSDIQCKTATDTSDKGGAMVWGGVPIIVVNPYKGSTAVTMTHELLHLYLATRGFETNPKWPEPPNIPSGYTLDRAWRFEIVMYDELQHLIIGPIMKSMGLNINDTFAPSIRNLVLTDGVQYPPEQAIVNMLRLSDAGDDDVLRQYEEWLERSGYSSEERLGEWVIGQVRTRTLDTTATAMDFSELVCQKVMSDRAYERSGPFL